MSIPLRRSCWPLTARWLSDCDILSSTSACGTSCWRADQRSVARAGARGAAPPPPRAHLAMSSLSSQLLSASSSCCVFVFAAAVEHWKLWRQNKNVLYLLIFLLITVVGFIPLKCYYNLRFVQLERDIFYPYRRVLLLIYKRNYEFFRSEPGQSYLLVNSPHESRFNLFWRLDVFNHALNT